MNKYKIPLSLITIFHPEEFWELETKELEKFPSLKKDRQQQELMKEKIAKEKEMAIYIEQMHGGPIKNFGKPHYWFRKNWISGKKILDILSDYSFRLIDTDEDMRSQARWKLEGRPNWGSEPNILPEYLLIKLRRVFAEKRVSVRQFWVNPFTFDFKEKIQNSFYEHGYTANLVLGPCDPYNNECIREAYINFIKNNTLLPIHQHRPFYRDSLTPHEIEIIEGCTLWMAEY